MRLKTGKLGEDHAVEYLLAQEYTVLSRNFRSRFGEIDVVAYDAVNKTTVFVEVRTKTSDSFGRAEESLTQSKKTRLYKTAQFYVARYQVDNFRFDLIAINLNEENPIQHFKNIIEV